jgi:hypothetical protein
MLVLNAEWLCWLYWIAILAMLAVSGRKICWLAVMAFSM